MVVSQVPLTNIQQLANFIKLLTKRAKLTLEDILADTLLGEGRKASLTCSRLGSVL